MLFILVAALHRIFPRMNPPTRDFRSSVGKVKALFFWRFSSRDGLQLDKHRAGRSEPFFGSVFLLMWHTEVMSSKSANCVLFEIDSEESIMNDYVSEFTTGASEESKGGTAAAKHVTHSISDEQFMDDVNQLKALRSYMIRQAKIVEVGRIELGDLIPFTHHIEPTIYGNDVMDLTIFGLRSI
jgi:hypothetical protein